jgi:hypothetical protein
MGVPVRRRFGASFVVLVTLVSLLFGSVPASGAGGGGTDPGARTEAEAALARAQALFASAAFDGTVARRDPRSATLVLRDLVLRLNDLSATDRAAALALLARPTDGDADDQDQGYKVEEATPICTTRACVHYVTTTVDAPPADDDDDDGVPDYIETVVDTTDEVWDREITQFGFRRPKSDVTSENNGGNGLIDIYVAQIGNDGLYGYCTTDDPNASDPDYPTWDFSAYCVVDNDFDIGEFPPPSANGVEALQVTVAHEFFHAVQYAYDAAEDRWFMESSASWMEDEVFDDVDDNLQYLSASPLSQPQVPLDNNIRFNVYGNWVFHRYLSESTGSADVIREAWERADSTGQTDPFSIRAIDGALADLGSSFEEAFIGFTMVNGAPEHFYEEGERYRTPPFTRRVAITRKDGGAEGGTSLDHLSARYFAFEPATGVSGGARLLVEVDGPPRSSAPGASVVVTYEDGTVEFVPVALNKKGVGEVRVDFGRQAVTEVVLVLANASIRSRCLVDPSWKFSCLGDPKDDNERFDYAVTLIQ